MFGCCIHIIVKIGFQSSNSRNAANDGTARGPDSHLVNPKNYRYGALNLAALHHKWVGQCCLIGHKLTTNSLRPTISRFVPLLLVVIDIRLQPNLSLFRFDRFSQNGEALSALHEAIQMAQEAGDAICLQYALGWLHLITEQVDGEGP